MRHGIAQSGAATARAERQGAAAPREPALDRNEAEEVDGSSNGTRSRSRSLAECRSRSGFHRLGESLVDAVVGQWLKSEGDAVSRGETIVELETDKVNLDVTAPEDGVLGKIEQQRRRCRHRRRTARHGRRGRRRRAANGAGRRRPASRSPRRAPSPVQSRRRRRAPSPRRPRRAASQQRMAAAPRRPCAGWPTSTTSISNALAGPARWPRHPRGCARRGCRNLTTPAKAPDTRAQPRLHRLLPLQRQPPPRLASAPAVR